VSAYNANGFVENFGAHGHGNCPSGACWSGCVAEQYRLLTYCKQRKSAEVAPSVYAGHRIRFKAKASSHVELLLA